MIGRDETPVEVAMDESSEEQPAEEAALAEEAEEAAEPEPEPEVVAAPERYVLRPIYFDFDSFGLSAESKSKLDHLVSLLQKFPELKLEIAGYTDAIGTFDYNQRLSESRAKAVSKYITSAGVAEGRLTVTGMSESEPVARNRTKDNRDAPDGRMLNRRVQFGVSLQEGVIIEMEKVEVPDHLKLDDKQSAQYNEGAPSDPYVLRPIYFAFDSYALSAESKGELDKLAYLLKNFSELKLSIAGHTDAKGDFDYNQQLSTKRAKAASDYLVTAGIDPQRLTLSGKSESEPLAANKTKDNKDAPEGRKLNRRVQFNLSPLEGTNIVMEEVEVPDHLKLVV